MTNQTKLPDEIISEHALNCDVRYTQDINKCTCKAVQMSDQDFGQLMTRLDRMAEEDPWIGFKPTGIQKDVHAAYKQYPTNLFECFVQGPNQIYKTTASQWLLKDVLRREGEFRKFHEDEPLHILIMTPKQNLQFSGFQKRFLDWNPGWFRDNVKGRPALKGQSKAFAAVDFQNGDHIQWETFDAGPSYIEVVSAHLVILDDGVEYYNDFYPFLFQRIVHHKGILHASFIPPPPTDPFYKTFIEPARKGIKEPLREVIFGNEKHYIQANGLELYEKCKRNYPERIFNQKVKGLNSGSGRLVYDDFDTKINVIPEETICKYQEQTFNLKEIPHDWCRRITIDWANTDNPKDTPVERKKKTVALFYAIPPPGTEIILPNGESRIVGEDADSNVLVLYNGYECDQRRLAIEHAQAIVDLWETRDNWTERFEEIKIDNATGVKDGTSDRSVFEDFEGVFNKNGAMSVTKSIHKWKKDMSSKDGKEQTGHDLVAKYIKQRRALIVKNGKTEFIIDSFLYYENDPKTNMPRTYGDDEQDAWRYAVNDKPTYFDPYQLDPPPYIVAPRSQNILELIAKSRNNNDDMVQAYLNRSKATRRRTW